LLSSNLFFQNATRSPQIYTLQNAAKWKEIRCPYGKLATLLLTEKVLKDFDNPICK